LTVAGDRVGYQLSDAVRLLDIAESYKRQMSQRCWR
jgi:hypothetical protein